MELSFYHRSYENVSPNVSNQTKNFGRYIKPLLALNLLSLTNTNKPNISNQQYVTSDAGLFYIQSN
jgi:hypothetical protein